MQNFPFYGRPMRVQFAKSKSDVVSKADGSFEKRPKRKTADSKDKKAKEPPSKKKKLDDSKDKKDEHKEPK